MVIETPYRIEPCLLSYQPDMLRLAKELIDRASVLSFGRPKEMIERLAAMARIEDCHYSHRIENLTIGMDDIERILHDNHVSHALRREVLAFIRVRQKMDDMHAKEALPEPASVEFIQWLHAELFYSDENIKPGQFRDKAVVVGRHLPPDTHRVDDFMSYFEKKYRFSEMNQVQRVLAIAPAHHRFSYIHPFLDGNGRVGRLMAHAMCLAANIGASGIWSISKGLWDSLKYKQMMAMADSPRRGDLDGRGNLSQSALLDYSRWFLGVCLAEVDGKISARHH